MEPIFVNDYNLLKKNIANIIKYVDSNTCLDKIALKIQLLELFPTVPGSIISLLTLSADLKERNQSVEMLLGLIDNLQKAKDGQTTIEDVKNNFTQQVAETCVMPYLKK